MARKADISQTLDLSSILFTYDSGHPLVFYTPSATLREELSPLVNSGGGILVDTLDCEEVKEMNELKNPIYTIVDGNTYLCSEEAPNILHVDYIFECVEMGKLLPTESFRITVSCDLQPVSLSQDSVDKQLLQLLADMDTESPSDVSITDVSHKEYQTGVDRELVKRDLFKNHNSCKNTKHSNGGSDPLDPLLCVVGHVPCSKGNIDEKATHNQVKDTLQALQEKLIRLYIERGSCSASFEEKCSLLVEYTDFSYEECCDAMYVMSGDISKALYHLFHIHTTDCWTKSQDEILLAGLKNMCVQIGDLSPIDIANRLHFLAHCVLQK